jgi:hypothetical protein
MSIEKYEGGLCLDDFKNTNNVKDTDDYNFQNLAN